MIHYNLWFRFRSDVDETNGLAAVRGFLDGLHATDEIAGFQILKNSGTGAKTKMLPLQAIIEFSDDAQFSSAFSAQAARGIHTGLHGQVMALVSEFQVEIFRQLWSSSASTSRKAIGDYCCEV